MNISVSLLFNQALVTSPAVGGEDERGRSSFLLLCLINSGKPACPVKWKLGISDYLCRLCCIKSVERLVPRAVNAALRGC